MRLLRTLSGAGRQESRKVEVFYVYPGTSHWRTAHLGDVRGQDESVESDERLRTVGAPAIVTNDTKAANVARSGPTCASPSTWPQSLSRPRSTPEPGGLANASDDIGGRAIEGRQPPWIYSSPRRRTAEE
jgi:hypothetical protein